MPFRFVTDATVAIFVALLLFIIPAHKPSGGFCCSQSSSDLEEDKEGKEQGGLQNLGRVLGKREGPCCQLPGLYGFGVPSLKGPSPWPSSLGRASSSSGPQRGLCYPPPPTAPPALWPLRSCAAEC